MGSGDVPPGPDVAHQNSDPAYLRALLERARVSQKEAARKLDVSERMMRYYLADRGPKHKSAPYLVQFALEALARVGDYQAAVDAEIKRS